MDRVILHCDANSFYASCELVYHPELRGLPMSVAGDGDQRHGIILASTPEAKRCGIKTGMVTWEAKKLCPNLITMPANFERYKNFSRRLRAMFREYTPIVTPYGLDEAWVDLTGRGVTIDDGTMIAQTLRQRAKDELGLTLSAGISFTYCFSKLGSDMKKPDASTIISRENYQQLVWPLPAGDLLFVGPHTVPKLAACGLYTIGDIANAPEGLLESLFGKVGLMHVRHATGQYDKPPIPPEEMESVGHSVTAPRDMESISDVRCVYTALAEAVSMRMRHSGVVGRCINIHVRDSKLNVRGCQKTIGYHTSLSREIVHVAMELFFSKQYERMLPLRSIGVSVSSLRHATDPVQLDIFGDEKRRQKEISLAGTVDELRSRFGTMMIRRGNVLASPSFANINAFDDHTIYPGGDREKKGGSRCKNYLGH